METRSVTENSVNTHTHIHETRRHTCKHLDKVVRVHDEGGVGAGGRFAAAGCAGARLEVEEPLALLFALDLEGEHGVGLLDDFGAQHRRDGGEHLLHRTAGAGRRRSGRRRSGGLFAGVLQELVQEKVRHQRRACSKSQSIRLASSL